MMFYTFLLSGTDNVYKVSNMEYIVLQCISQEADILRGGYLYLTASAGGLPRSGRAWPAVDISCVGS